MLFAKNQFAANGTAALALVAALLDHLQEDGTLTPKDKKSITAKAQAIAPQGVGISDREAQAILASLIE